MICMQSDLFVARQPAVYPRCSPQPCYVDPRMPRPGDCPAFCLVAGDGPSDPGIEFGHGIWVLEHRLTFFDCPQAPVGPLDVSFAWIEQ